MNKIIDNDKHQSVVTSIAPPVYLRERNGGFVILQSQEAINSQLKQWLKLGAVIIEDDNHE